MSNAQQGQEIDFNIDRNGIARKEFRMIKPNLFFFDFLNNLHNIPQKFFSSAGIRQDV